LAAVIEDRFHIKPKLIEGSGGAFEVAIDGRLIFSKKKEGRFPEHDEILKSLAALSRS
jgi:selenoprotein W-related protein